MVPAAPYRNRVGATAAYVINSSNDSLVAFDVCDPERPARYFIQVRPIKMTYSLALNDRCLYFAGRESRSFIVVDHKN